MFWWLWMLVVLVLIIGILMSVWWALSVFNLNSRSQSWAQRLSQKPKIKFYDQLEALDQNPAIVLMVVGQEWKDEDNFWPVYLFATTNLQEAITYWTEKIMHDWQNNHPSIIVDYLKDTEQNIDQIEFYVLKKTKNKKNIVGQAEAMIRQLKLSEKSFNQNFGH